MRRIPRSLLALAAVPAVLAGAGGRMAPAAADAAGPHLPALHALAFDVLPNISRIGSDAVAPPAQQLHIAVQLGNPRAAALRQLAFDIHDPHSPEFHRFRTPAQLTAEFGLSQATGDELRAWLRSGGLAISYASPSNDFVQATGSVAQVDALFHVTIRHHHVAGLDFIANDVAPQVPADLDILSLAGLNSLQQFTTPKLRVAQHPTPHSSGCFAPAPAPCETSYDPADMWSLQNMPANNLGQGQTMAIFGEGQTDPVIADLRRFEQHNHLPRVPVTVRHVGAGPFINNDGQGEWNLDSQSSTGMAPDVNRLVLYFASTLSDADVQTEFTAWKDDASGPHQANASFGECESNPLNPVVGNPAAYPAIPASQGLGDNLEPAIETTLMPQIVAEGRTLFNSTGDTGSSCPVVILSGLGAGNGLLNQAFPLQNYPAASDFVMAVGGTLLYSDGGTPAKRVNEYSSPYGGGGSSIFNAEPPWQKSMSTINRPCVIDYTGKADAAGTVCRGIPDVAALFGDVIALGYHVMLDGRFITTGGTSLSSPLWMGMWTRAQAAAANQVTGLGFATPIIYEKGKGANYAQDFYDITIGSNGYYAAGPGWDYTTGFGSPNLTNLIQDIDGRTAPVRADEQVPAPLQTLNPCGPVFLSPAGNAVDYNLFNYPGGIQNQPQLDIVRGDLFLTNDGKSLRTVMTISNLSTALPADATPVSTVLPAGEDWTFDVVLGGTTWYADAHYDTVQGKVSFVDGSVDNASGSASAKGAIVGQFNPGANGTIVMDIPLADIGSPKPGDRLQEPFAFTTINSALPFLNFPDAAGAQFDYQLGSERHCAPGVVPPTVGNPLPGELPPPTITPTPNTSGVTATQWAPVGALGLLGAAALRRRRRSAPR